MISSIKVYIIRNCPSFLINLSVNIIKSLRFIKYKTLMIFFPGKMRLYCPCCGMKYKSFNAGTFSQLSERFDTRRYKNTRQDVVCPYCRSFPRHRIFALWSNKHKDYLQNSDILYFAPEYSMTLWMKRNKIKYVSADLYSKADLKLDIQATGLPDESFDVIICNHVLEHVDDFRMALNEMYRILRKGGSFICSFPMDPNVELLEEDSSVITEDERILKYGQNDHKRLFGMHADRFLSETGFSVKRISGEKCSKRIMPIVGPADYDINLLFRCIKR